MPELSILGINNKKCIDCGECVRICIMGFLKRDNLTGEIIVNDPEYTCSGCGQCIAVCPTEAINFEGSDDLFTFEGFENNQNAANYDILYRLFRANRSTRFYKKEKVPKEILEKVFDAMRYAPTGGNMRSERFVLISDSKKIKQLSDAVSEEILKNPGLSHRYKPYLPLFKKYFDAFIYFDAPHVIFVYSPLNHTFAPNNIANIVTYGRLAAHSLGLGTCWNGWTQMTMMLNPKLMKIAGIRGKTIGAFTIGYPDVKYYRAPPRTRKFIKGFD